MMRQWGAPEPYVIMAPAVATAEGCLNSIRMVIGSVTYFGKIIAISWRSLRVGSASEINIELLIYN